MAAWKQLLFVIVIFSFSIVSNAKYGFFPTKFSTSANPLTPVPSAAKQTLLYYGGPVISNVKIHVVWWSDYVNPQTQDFVPGFYSALTNSNFMDWLDQYNTFATPVTNVGGTKQHIGRGQYTGATTIKPFNHSPNIDDSEIQIELAKQIQAGQLPPPDDNTLYMIYFPRAYQITAFGMSSCVNFCAYHSSHGTPTTPHFFYGIMPDIHNTGCDMGCAYASDDIRSLSTISAHEYTEAITDPFPAPGNTVVWPQAWNTVDGSEIGDLCAGGNDALVAGKESYTVQCEFDNSHNNCTNRTWTSP